MAMVSIEDWKKKKLTCKSQWEFYRRMISRQQETENLWTSYDRDASLRAFHSNDCILKTYRHLYITSVPTWRRPPAFRPRDPEGWGHRHLHSSGNGRQQKNNRWNSEYRFNSDLITVTSPSLLPSLVADELRSLVMRLLRVIRGRGIHFCRRD